MGIAVGYGRADVFGDSVDRLAGIDPLWLAQAVTALRRGSLVTHCDLCDAPIYERDTRVSETFWCRDSEGWEDLTVCAACADVEECDG